MTSFKAESYIWYGFVVAMVIARMTSRILHFKSVFRLQIEDYLMVFMTFLYTAFIIFLNIDLYVNTNLIDPDNPVTEFTPEDIADRVWGSKTILFVEQAMCFLQWGTKACLLLLYWRLTQNLKQSMIVKCAAVYVAGTYITMELLFFAYWCRPFNNYWQVPTNDPNCNTAINHMILNFAFNLSSDVLIMSIPLPILLRAKLEPKRRFLLAFPFVLGMFTMICAILSKAKSFAQPYNIYWVYWYCREASTAMIVANMPYTWALLRRMFKLRSFFGDSTAAELSRGRLRKLHGQGYSEGAVQLSSGPRSARKGSVQLLSRGDNASQNHDHMEVHGRELHNLGSTEDEDTHVRTGAASTTTSSDASIKERSTVQAAEPTDWTLDRLYPLEDVESGTKKTKLAPYEG